MTTKTNHTYRSACRCGAEIYSDDRDEYARLMEQHVTTCETLARREGILDVLLSERCAIAGSIFNRGYPIVFDEPDYRLADADPGVSIRYKKGMTPHEKLDYMEAIMSDE